MFFFFFFQAEDGIRDYKVTGVQTCALPIAAGEAARRHVAERGPIVAALEPSREPRLRRGPRLLRARVPKDRILGLFQRIGAALEDVPSVIQAARVEAQGE